MGRSQSVSTHQPNQTIKQMKNTSGTEIKESFLIDAVQQIFEGAGTKFTRNGFWFMAKPKGIRYKRWKGAWRVLTGKSIPVHFAEDDKYINVDLIKP